jgi:putative YphP/YqiW family bacilliredoxin
MREELTHVGFKELRTGAAVDEAIVNLKGTMLIFINSVCGCAAGMARPGMVLALQNRNQPDQLATVFAGQDLEAVARVRQLLGDIPPSSPSIALFKDGAPVWFMPRQHIEGRSALDVANGIAEAFEKHCRKEVAA